MEGHECEKNWVMRNSRQLWTVESEGTKNSENVEYFNYFGSIITNAAWCTGEIKSRIAMAEAAFNKNNLFMNKLKWNLRKKLVKWYICSIAVYGVETWTFRKVDQKYLESCQIWCSRKTEKIRCTDHVEKVHGVMEKRNMLYAIKDGRLTGSVTSCAGIAV